jgi:hypothetical protein
MTRVPLSKEDADFIAHRIAAITRGDEGTPWVRFYVSAFDALPIYAGWYETVGLRPDGHLVRWSTEDECEGVREVDDRILARIALVQCARQYPELKHLVPVRPPGARTCPTCDGTGHMPPPIPATVICSCGGVGWVDGPAD